MQTPPPGGAVQYRSPYPYAYYPGQLPYGPPQPAKDDSLKKVIIYVVVFTVVVAVVTVIAALLHLYIESMVPDPEIRPTVNLASPSIEGLDRGGNTVWDVTMNVNRVAPRDQQVPWSEVTMMIKSSSGSVLLPSTHLPLDFGVYDGTDPIDVQAWHIEATGNDLLSAGDTIKITGMSVDYEGALMELVFEGNFIGMATLPTNFP